MVPPSESDSENESPSSGNESEAQRHNLVQKYKHERSDSEDEMKIPLAELARRLKRKEESNYSDSSSGDEDKPSGSTLSTYDFSTL